MNSINSSITKKLIRERFSDIVYKRAQSYYQYGRVIDLKYDEDEQEWFADVIGKSDDYEVTVKEFVTRIRCSCTCPAMDTYGECKHVAAVMLEISDRLEEQAAGINIPYHHLKEDQMVMRLIERFTEQSQPAVRKTPNTQPVLLNTEFILKTQPIATSFSADYGFTIEMKTGDKRVYMVKKIKEFLDAIKTEKPYEFTKNFTYDPSQHSFGAGDLEIVHLLAEISQNEQVYHSQLSSYYPHRTTSGGKGLFIPPYAAEPLLKQLKNSSFQYEHKGTIYKNIDVVSDHPPLLFPLDKSEVRPGAFKLELDQLQSMTLFSTYEKLFDQGVFYSLTPEQLALYNEFLAVSRQNIGEMIISEEQIEPFLAHVAPRLKKIGKLNLSASVSDHIVSRPLKIKMLVDGDDDHLDVKVEYQYGDQTINPISQEKRDDEEKNQILIRDASKELEFMNIVDRSAFKPEGDKLTLDGEEALFDFLYHVLPDLQEKAEIFLTNAVRAIIMPESSAPIASVDLDSKGNWLEVKFDIEGIDTADIQNVLKAAVEKKKYYRLTDGTFVSLESEDFQNINQMFSELDIKSKALTDGALQLPVYRGLQVEEIVNNGNPGSSFGKSFRRLINQLKHPEDQDFELPGTLKATLRDYQTTGYQWLHSLADYRLGGILADDMGLGKTIQAITYILSRKEEGAKEPILVVAPASLVYNWKHEFEKFSPDLVCNLIVGSPGERQSLLEDEKKVDVWITSYPLLRQDVSYYEDKNFDTLILDEAQAIKNHTTKTFAAAQTIKASRRFALSGTPIENSLDELWSVFQTIMPGFFRNKAAFSRLSHEQIAKRVKPFILRRLKKDVLKELPDKIETVHESDLTNEQKTLYLAYLEKIQRETKDTIASEGFQKNRMKILAGLTRLRQICCHPSLFLENYDGDSGKLEQLSEIVSQSIQNGQRLLIFSQFASMLRMIHEKFSEEGYQTFYLDGQTPSKERVEMAEKFNQGEKEIFLISLKAGGTGLNLTGADTVILYDLWWNPAIEEQAAGRAHRIGQKKVVQVIRLITRGTLEEKIHDMQNQKKELIEKVIQPGETMLSSFSEDDIREILNI